MFVEYSFSLELYARITFWDLSVKPSCIVVGIHKRVAGLWPRLLHGRSRPPWLTFDVEHSTLMSSDDEGNSDVNTPLTLLTRALNAQRFGRLIFAAVRKSVGLKGLKCEEVTGSAPGHYINSVHGVHAHVRLPPSSIVWYWPNGGDAVCLGTFW